MDQALIEGHLRRAEQARSSDERFSYAWKAFNVLFEDGAARDDSQTKLYRAAVRRLATNPGAIFNQIQLRPLVCIDPVFDEKAWHRAGEKDTRRHEQVRQRLAQLDARRASTEDVVALADLLYVIRCNLEHGFKTPERPRDSEVLDASAPVLIALVRALFAEQLKTTSRSA